MKKRETHGSRRTAVAALCMGLAVAACTRSNEPSAGSGESHFLASCGDGGCGPELDCLAGVCSAACEASSGCERFAEESTCEAPPGARDAARLCDVRCARDEDCGELGAGFGCEAGRCREPARAAPDAGEPEPTCPGGCVAVRGYPVDAERGCVDRAGLAFLGCDCSGTQGASVLCGRRTADDAVWALSDGRLDAAAGFADCTAEESALISHACEFADCEVPPLSICTLEATCADRGCDNFQYDARGCRRRPCESDVDCAADDRCVRLDCMDASFCWVGNAGPEETCGCGGPGVCIEGAACNPVATVGPRGAWSSLELTSTNLICLAGCSGECPQCRSRWTVDPSGTVVIQGTGMGATEPRTATLSDFDRAELTRIIDGPTLRAGLRDGFDCGQIGGDTSIVLRLALPDATLEQDITLCTVSRETEVGRLSQLLFSY